MLDERELGEELRELVDGITPRAGLAEAVISRRRATRRRTGAAGAALGGAGALAAALALAVGSGSGGGGATTTDGRSELHLDAYRFTLPRGSRSVAAASSAACAMGAFTVDPGPSNPGGGTADEPAVASAITGDGGCVSMLLTGPYTPGSADTPQPFYYPLDSSPVTIDGDSGTVGTYEFLGGEDTTIHGVQVPSGTENTELFLELPAAGGQVQELVVAAGGVSESELESIVASGLAQ